MPISLPSDRPLRILVTRTDRIGDLVLSTPVFQALRSKFRNAWIACLTFCENRAIVDGNPYLNEIILYDKKGSERSWFGNLFFARQIAKKKFDLVIHLHATNRMHWISWLAGIPVRIGYNRKCAWALTHPFPDMKKDGLKHEAQYNFDLLKMIGVDEPGQLVTYFPLKDADGESFNQLVQHHRLPVDLPWIVLNPSASCPSKMWPAERFGELADKIAGKYPAVFIMVGTRSDRGLIEKVKRAAKGPLYDLSERLSLGLLGWLLKSAALLISNDSGPVHIADAVGTPVISIFGRQQPGLSPTRWRPLVASSRWIWKNVGCPKCLAHQCQIHFRCLDAISVENVFEQVEFFKERLQKEIVVP